jgi:membrane protease YdiL (CAAX protease family)
MDNKTYTQSAIQYPTWQKLNRIPSLRPMPFWMSLLFFGIPCAAGWLSIYVALPGLARLGMPLFWNFWLCLTLPLAGMLTTALIAYRLEGFPWIWKEIKIRFRLKPVRRKDWWWVLALIASIGLYLFLRQTLSSRLASLPGFAFPSYLPSILDPRLSQTSIPTDYLGMPLRGSWWILLVMFAVLCINIYGEEFLWRGYILPRQELVHGKWTWLIHGLLWTSFHSFWKWDVLAILPGALLLSYVAYRLKNTTPGITFHWVNNGLTLVATTLGILGLTL